MKKAAGKAKKKSVRRRKQEIDFVSKEEQGSILSLYINEVGDHDLLTKAEEKELAAKIKRGGRGTRAAKEKLAQSNLKLVIKIAKDFRNYGLDFEDLISEGNIGLLKAVDKFDPSKGAKFSTYASFWIKQCIYRALSNQSRVIRLPVHVGATHSKILKFINKYKEKNQGEQPSMDEICKAVKCTKQTATSILESGVTNVTSIDAKISQDGEGEQTLESVIEDKKNDRPDDAALIADNIDVIHKFLAKLSNRERFILYRRFGLGTMDKETLEKIGDKLSLTRERIRQVETIALRKLKFMLSNYYMTHPFVKKDYYKSRRKIRRTGTHKKNTK